MKSKYDAVAEIAVPIVRGIDDKQLDDSTPCSEYQVRDLMNHLFHVVVEFQKGARDEPMDFATTPDYLQGDWRSRFADEVDALSNAWSDPATLEGTTEQGFPRKFRAQLPLFDLAIHGWDLARATSQPYKSDDKLSADLLALSESMAPMAKGTDVFGPPVEVAADAPPFDRLLGATGRDPNWHA